MAQLFWGKKVGMTQMFVENKAVPVTVIDTSNWFVTSLKTKERDGYCAVQISHPRKRYADQEFSADWLKKMKDYFQFIKELRCDEISEGLEVGQRFDFATALAEGDKVNVTGTSKGCGFAGVVKRWNFAGAKASHGNRMGRRPGSIGNVTRSGRVIKGKKMPGRMGGDRIVSHKLRVISLDKDKAIIAVKGSIAGKPGSIVMVSK